MRLLNVSVTNLSMSSFRRVARAWFGMRPQAASGGWRVASSLEPLCEREVVDVGETLTGIDSVKQCVSWMVRGHPGPVGVGDLVVNPGE
jgi:hypothetical protein